MAQVKIFPLLFFVATLVCWFVDTDRALVLAVLTVSLVLDTDRGINNAP